MDAVETMAESGRGAVVVEQDYVIAGLRARPIREWFQHLALPVILVATSYEDGAFFRSERDWIKVGVAVAIGFHFLVKIARGRIELRSDRLAIQSWNDDKFLALNVEIPLSAIRTVSVAGTVMRIGHTADGRVRYSRVALVEPVAEELFDRLQARLEADPEIAERVEQKGAHRLVVARAGE